MPYNTNISNINLNEEGTPSITNRPHNKLLENTDFLKALTDTWDTYLDQAVKTTSSPTFAQVVIDNITLNAAAITSDTAIAINAGGSNQNVVLTPSGTGDTVLNGDVGIKTASPIADLDVRQNAMIADHDPTASFTPQSVGLLIASDTTHAALKLATYAANADDDPIINFLTSGGTNWSIGVDNGDSDSFKISGSGVLGTTDLITLKTGGYFGIGVNPSQTLHVLGASSAINDLNYSAIIVDDSAVATGVGGGILFQARLTDAPGYVGVAGVQGERENATSGNGAGALTFFSRPNGGNMTERMRIDSTGNIGINTTGPDRKLDILDVSNPQLRLTHTDATDYADFQVDTNGDLTITPSGTKVVIAGDCDVTGVLTATAQSIHTNGLTDGTATLNGSGVWTGVTSLTAGATVIDANGITLAAGDDLIGSSTSDITINTDKFTVAGSTGNTVIAGTCDITGVLTATGGIKTDGTNTLITKVIDIGNWNMDATDQVSVAHGITYGDIRGIQVIIRSDDAGVNYDISYVSTAGALGGGTYASSTNITLSRTTSGFFDNTSFNAPSYNRGWITITYVA